AVAAGFGLASVLSVIVLGDESGYTTGEVQKVKLAAIEAEWHTAPPPAPFMLFGIPNDKAERTDYAIKVPWALGLIATRSIDTPVVGIEELKHHAQDRIRSGIIAYGALQKLRAGDTSPQVRSQFDRHKDDLGHALLLKRYTDNPAAATPQQIRQAAADTIPKVSILFWAFRIMVGIGLIMLFIFAMAFYYLARRRLSPQRWLLRIAVWAIPLPWIAAEMGWIVAEYGRQPWTISGILPTFLSTSSVSAGTVISSLTGFVLFYTFLLVVELYLMFKYARLGPSSLGTGRYHLEAQEAAS
ncbi:MAG: cytochrome ubiquinol oxidase subunit I, partial [Burkholderiales bacterium]